MPDPNAPAIAYWYVGDDVTMLGLTAFLIKKGQWFDVRVIGGTIFKWSICFNAIVEVPKVIRKGLHPVPDTLQGSRSAPVAGGLDAYKAARKKMMRGK